MADTDNDKASFKKVVTVMLCGAAGGLIAGPLGFITIAFLSYKFYDEIKSSSG